MGIDDSLIEQGPMATEENIIEMNNGRWDQLELAVALACGPAWPVYG